MKKVLLVIFSIFIATSLSAQERIINAFNTEADIDTNYWQADRNGNANDENSHEQYADKSHSLMRSRLPGWISKQSARHFR